MHYHQPLDQPDLAAAALLARLLEANLDALLRCNPQQVSAISRSIAFVLDATSTDSAHEGRRDSGMLGTWQPSLQQQQQSATRSPALPSPCTQWWDVLAAVEVLVAGIAENGSSENQVTPSLLAAVCRWCTAQLAAQPRLNHNLAWDILSAQNRHQGQQRRQREALTWRDSVYWLHSSLLDTAALDVAARCSPEQACCVLVAIGAAQTPAPLPLICVLLHRAQDETVTASLVAEWSRIKASGSMKQQAQQQPLLQQQRQQQLWQLPLVPLAARVFEAVMRGADSGAGRQAGSDRLARSQAVARSAAVAAAIHALSCEGRASLEAALQSRAAGRCLHEHLLLLSEPAFVFVLWNMAACYTKPPPDIASCILEALYNRLPCMSGAALVSCTSALVLWSKLQVPDRLMHAILKAAMAAVGGGGGGGAGRPVLGAVPEAATAQQQQVAPPGWFKGRVDSARTADLLRGRGALAAGNVADAHITAQPAHDQDNRKAAAERSQTAARQQGEQGRRATGQGSHVASGMVGLLLSAVYSKRVLPTLLRQLLDRLASLAPSLGPTSAAAALWALAKLRYRKARSLRLGSSTTPSSWPSASRQNVRHGSASAAPSAGSSNLWGGPNSAWRLSFDRPRRGMKIAAPKHYVHWGRKKPALAFEVQRWPEWQAAARAVLEQAQQLPTRWSRHDLACALHALAKLSAGREQALMYRLVRSQAPRVDRQASATFLSILRHNYYPPGTQLPKALAEAKKLAAGGQLSADPARAQARMRAAPATLVTSSEQQPAWRQPLRRVVTQLLPSVLLHLPSFSAWELQLLVKALPQVQRMHPHGLDKYLVHRLSSALLHRTLGPADPATALGAAKGAMGAAAVQRSDAAAPALRQPAADAYANRTTINHAMAGAAAVPEPSSHAAGAAATGAAAPSAARQATASGAGEPAARTILSTFPAATLVMLAVSVSSLPRQPSLYWRQAFARLVEEQLGRLLLPSGARAAQSGASVAAAAATAAAMDAAGRRASMPADTRGVAVSTDARSTAQWSQGAALDQQVAVQSPSGHVGPAAASAPSAPAGHVVGLVQGQEGGSAAPSQPKASVTAVPVCDQTELVSDVASVRDVASGDLSDGTGASSEPPNTGAAAVAGSSSSMSSSTGSGVGGAAAGEAMAFGRLLVRPLRPQPSRASASSLKTGKDASQQGTEPGRGGGGGGTIGNGSSTRGIGRGGAGVTASKVARTRAARGASRVQVQAAAAVALLYCTQGNGLSDALAMRLLLAVKEDVWGTVRLMPDQVEQLVMAVSQNSQLRGQRRMWEPLLVPLVRARLFHFDGPALARILACMSCELRCIICSDRAIRRDLLPATRQALLGCKQASHLRLLLEGMAGYTALHGGAMIGPKWRKAYRKQAALLLTQASASPEELQRVLQAAEVLGL